MSVLGGSFRLSLSGSHSAVDELRTITNLHSDACALSGMVAFQTGKLFLSVVKGQAPLRCHSPSDALEPQRTTESPHRVPSTMARTCMTIV